MSEYTIKNLLEVDDAAPQAGMSDTLEARFARADLGGKNVGISLQRIKPDASVPFAHRHGESEEIYLVLSGSGRVLLGDEVREVKAFDAIRVAPTLLRTFAAGPDGLELVAFGQHVDDDNEMAEPTWPDAS